MIKDGFRNKTVLVYLIFHTHCILDESNTVIDQLRDEKQETVLWLKF